LLYGDPFKAGAVVPLNVALPRATQNELNGSEATVLVKNGCMAVSEGANMPDDLEGVHVFKAAKILYAPSKAANAGGVAVLDLEMSQNSARIPWKEAELQKMLSDNEWHLPSLRRIWWSRRQQAH
jgi:glutamate dehydrogenase (NADP+)